MAVLWENSAQLSGTAKYLYCQTFNHSILMKYLRMVAAAFLTTNEH